MSSFKLSIINLNIFRYSDLLVKKEDNLNHIKKNKFINLIENSQKENTDNIKKSDLRAYGNNQTITKQTKNKFFKQIQEFSYYLFNLVNPLIETTLIRK